MYKCRWFVRPRSMFRPAASIRNALGAANYCAGLSLLLSCPSVADRPIQPFERGLAAAWILVAVLVLIVAKRLNQPPQWKILHAVGFVYAAFVPLMLVVLMAPTQPSDFRTVAVVWWYWACGFGFVAAVLVLLEYDDPPDDSGGWGEPTISRKSHDPPPTKVDNQTPLLQV